MKKQFFRVKQLADQTFLRAEKSEILNHEELQIADQRTEFLRGAITSITKKISPSGPTNDIEKLIRKTFEYQLGTTFIEESKQQRECQLFQQILKEAGLTEQQLAREYAEHEMKVEELVYTPFQNVLENEFPNVLKHKHNLRKYCLDKDSASNRYHATRKETLKEDMEEADTKVEQSRDILAIEMFSILAKENEFSEYILQLLKLQRGYHESALKNLETIIPQLEKKIGDSPVRRVFGTTLKEHLRITSKKIAYPLEICITALSEYGMLEEGLFRVAASASKVKRLKSAIDSGCFSFLIPEYRDAHVLASILKLYLRELPEPLLTFHLHKEWIEAMHSPENQRLEIVRSIIAKLPQENKDNLSYLFQFLSRLTQYPENKMSPSNIAIVLSPNLLWTKNEKESVNIGNCVIINMLIELFIKEVDVLFPDDVSNYVTLSTMFQDEEILNYNKINDGSMDIRIGSPRPNIRKKKSAPVPPNNMNKYDHHDNLNEQVVVCNTKLNNRETTKVNIGINTDDSIRDKSYSEDNIFDCIRNKNQQQRKNSDCIDTQYLVEVSTDNVHASRNSDPADKKYKTTVSYPVNQVNTPISQKPVTHKQTVDKNTSSMIKPQNMVDTVENNLRKKELINRAVKPEVPARPLSLTKRSSTDVDPVFKKTHCSVYNVADKLQPSIINIETKNETVAPKQQDMEKEPTDKQLRFKKVENKLCDINFNCSKEQTSMVDGNIPVAPAEKFLTEVDDAKKTKSSEHLNLNIEKLNYCNEQFSNDKKCNHVRAKSDGSVIDLEKENTAVLHVPSRNLNKPTQPPPPPPEL